MASRLASWILRSTLLLTVLSACGGVSDDAFEETYVETIEQEIVNGQPTSGDPATVYVDVGCTGTLVTKRTVLTACHCLENTFGQVSVFFGSNINQSGTWISATHYEVYPGQCVGPGDLAMITLSQDGPTAPIPINDKDLAPYIGDPMRIVGFGVTGENSGGSGTKREGTTTLANVDSGVMWSNPAGQSGTCYGDSGGPNFMMIDGVEKVTGVTSYGTAACGSGQDAAARTDPYYSWIMNYIATHDPAPADCGADGQCASGCAAPDPDCPCAADSFCTDACPEPASDPDCDNCETDGVCNPGCPQLDTDCCAADGECFPACGDQDPDCATGSGGGMTPGGGGAGGDSATSGGAGANEGQPQPDDDDDDRRVWKPSACSAGPAAAPTPSGMLGWSLLALGLMIVRRRRS